MLNLLNFALSEHTLLWVSAAASAICLVTIANYLPWYITALISSVLDFILRWRNPIASTDGRAQLPTCPYQWPNGQGDRAKFLDGIENRAQWGKQHGRIYSIWSGMKREVVITQAEHLQVVFRDSDKHTKAVDNNSGYLMSELLGQCLGLISSQPWRQLRAATASPFHHQEMTCYVDMISRHTKAHFGALHKTENLQFGRIHPAQDLKMLPFWIVAEILYGDLDENSKAELRQISILRESLFQRVMQGGIVRWKWSRLLPSATNRMLAEFQRRWTAFNQQAYHRARTNEPRAPIVAFMEDVTSGTITIEQVLQTIDEALFANLDVTTGGISWNLVFLAANPQVQARVRSETLAATDLKSHLLSGSTFVASCIMESARLKPLAAFSVPQSAPTDRVVGGYVIPAGTDFVVDSYALNVENEFWGVDRREYRPERFLEHHSTSLRYQYWRFGFGPRQCLGRYLADLIMRSLLVHLTSHYELGWVTENGASNAQWSRDAASWITLPDMELRCERRKD